jgi:hypothetical protein
VYRYPVFAVDAGGRTFCVAAQGTTASVAPRGPESVSLGTAPSTFEEEPRVERHSLVLRDNVTHAQVGASCTL